MQWWSWLQVGGLGGAWRGLLRGAEVRRGSLLPPTWLLLLLLLLAVASHSLLAIRRHLLLLGILHPAHANLAPSL